MANKVENLGLIITLIVILSFLSINFQFNLAVIYTIMLFGIYMIYDQQDLSIYRLFNGRNQIVPAFGIALGAYIVFYALASTLTPLVFSVDPSVTTQDLLGGFAQSTIFQGSQFFNFISVAGLIPIIESLLFFSALVGFSHIITKTSTNIDFTNVNQIAIVLMISALFVVFHITAKGVTNARDLFVTFLFAVTSIYLVLWTKRAFDAVLFHNITNTLALS